MKFKLVVLLALVLWMTAVNAESVVLLHDVFQDHVVLQRDQPIVIWGKATPNVQLAIHIANNAVSVQADTAGQWQAKLPAMAAGGPHTLSVQTSDGSIQTVNDVLIGDVWLCSGQSNMEFQVNRALYNRTEVENSSNNTIRMLTVPLSSSALPLNTFASPVKWQIAAPETTGNFSAVCYFFARELQKTVSVPMGLITAAWGGSKIEAWLSESALHAAGGYDAKLNVLHQYAVDPMKANTAWGQMWQAWWHSHPFIAGDDEPWREIKNDKHPAGWRDTPAELTPWETWGVPELANYDGMVWYRKVIKVTAPQAKQIAVLTLGTVDEVDQTWVNGRAIGSTSGAGINREYTLPVGVLHAGDNTIVVNALDTWAYGGMYGPTALRMLKLANGQTIPLEGKWQYKIAPPNLSAAPRAPWENVAGMGTIYNGMIAPLTTASAGYSLRGALWYQGESNTDQPERYQQLLAQLTRDWRQIFAEHLPVLVVQLPNFGAATTLPVNNDWAQLREVQRRAVASDPNMGLAVTIDIGDRRELHPPNKQEVGRRLARVARHMVYGETIAPSGPVAIQAQRQQDAVVISFKDITGKLLAYGAEGPIGFELCGANADSCHYANAVIKDNQIIVRAKNIAAATRVHYAWAGSPVVNLYDESELPVGPFELMIQ